MVEARDSIGRWVSTLRSTSASPAAKQAARKGLLRESKRRTSGWMGLANTGGQDIDLTRHVRTPAGVRYFHKPIGSPIGGGSGRGSSRVSLKQGSAADSVFGTGRWFRNSHGGVTNGTHTIHREPGNPPETPFTLYRGTKAVGRHETLNEAKAHATTKFKAKEGSTGVPPSIANAFPGAKVQPKVKAPGSTQHPQALRDATPDDLLLPGTMFRAGDIAKIREAASHITAEDRKKIDTDLGLNPKFSGHTPKQLRKQATNRRASAADRKEAREELLKRAQAANMIQHEGPKFLADLAEATAAKPEDADLAPIIGETLAAHPKLGALAHIYDRLRLAHYNFRKASTADVVKDKLGDVGRGVATVLLATVLLHLGIGVPGLVGGGGG